MSSCTSVWVVMAAIACVRAQDVADDKVAAARVALTGWLDSDHSDPKLLDKCVGAILAAGPAAIADVGARANAPDAMADAHTRRGLDAVITHVTVGFLQREAKTEMVFEGQYDALRPLQPFVGKLLLRLLLDTPDWYSQLDRHRLVFPLRDVYPQSPGEGVCKQLREVATDSDLEPDAVRQNLAFALAQWGDRSLIDARIAQVTKDAEAEDISAERRAALRYELADIHYTLREYARAAQIHVEMLRRAESTDTELQPVHYYNAACCLARSGATQPALDELERAVRLMRSGRVDPSLLLKRKLFERDPDLASIRGHERFRVLVQTAFGDGDGERETGGRGKDG